MFPSQTCKKEIRKILDTTEMIFKGYSAAAYFKNKI